MCYLGGIMAHTRKTASASRSGRTEKVSVSLDRELLARMRARATRAFDGNLSALIEEGARRELEEEGREKLAAWCSQFVTLTPEALEAIRAEWTGTAKPASRRRRHAA
jgi:hypothetical protein